MTPTPTFWRRLAIVLSVFNVAGAGFALASNEGWHAGIHVSLAVVFAFAAQRLKQDSGGGGSELARIQQQVDEQAIALQEAQAALANQSTQLAELQERVDFAERLLTQVRDRQTLKQ
jgi:TRAP-type uncharacterized transport system fused permease subunit